MSSQQPHVPELYVRVVEVVLRCFREGHVAYRVSTLPGGHKLEGSKKPTGRVVQWFEELFFQFSGDVQQLDVKLLALDSDRPELLASCALDVATLPEHTVREMWLPLVPAKAATSAVAKSPRNNKDKMHNEETFGGEVHLLLYPARQSELNIAVVKLQQPEYEAVLAALCTEPFTVALSLCDAAPQASGDRLASALVSVLMSRKVVLQFIRTVVEREVESTAQSNVLFRANSMAIRILSALGRLVGEPYLRRVLGDLLIEICSDDASYDPDAHPPNSDKAASCAAHIGQLAERFLKRILENVDAVPPILRIVCADVRRSVGAKFADFWPRAVGAFFFLRFVCPAIAAPSNAGLVVHIPPRNARRTLILITKVLQNIANRTTSSEGWMSSLEDVIAAQTVQVEKFLDALSAPGSLVNETTAEAAVGDLSGPIQAIKAIAEVKDIVVGSLQLEPASFIECLRQTTKISKPFSRANYHATLAAQGAVLFEMLTGTGGIWQPGAAAAAAAAASSANASSANLNALSAATAAPVCVPVDAKTVVNNTTCLRALPVDTEAVALELASSATAVLRAQLEKDIENQFFVTQPEFFVDWTAMRLGQRFIAFEKGLADLHFIRPDSVPAECRVALWINIVNTITFHCYTVHDGKPGKALAEDLYLIAGHLFTCEDVAYGILRGNYVKGKGARKNLIKADDPRKAFIMPLDSRINFCIATYTWDSPVLRPYDSNQASIKRAATVYCDKNILADLSRMEVSYPKLLEDNKVDWHEDDVSDRLMSMIAFLNARKLDMTELLRNPKVSIVLAKSKPMGQQSLYWMSQMRTDAIDFEKAKSARQQAIPKLVTVSRDEAVSLNKLMTQAVSPRKLEESSSTGMSVSPPSSPSPTSLLSSSGSWQRAMRGPDARTSNASAVPVKILTRKSSQLAEAKPRAQIPSNSSSQQPSPADAFVSGAEQLQTAAEMKQARRSPRSPRVGVRNLFQEGNNGGNRLSGWAEEDPLGASSGMVQQVTASPQSSPQPLSSSTTSVTTDTGPVAPPSPPSPSGNASPGLDQSSSLSSSGLRSSSGLLLQNPSSSVPIPIGGLLIKGRSGSRSLSDAGQTEAAATAANNAGSGANLNSSSSLISGTNSGSVISAPNSVIESSGAFSVDSALAASSDRSPSSSPRGAAPPIPPKPNRTPPMKHKNSSVPSSSTSSSNPNSAPGSTRASHVRSVSGAGLSTPPSGGDVSPNFSRSSPNLNRVSPNLSRAKPSAEVQQQQQQQQQALRDMSSSPAPENSPRMAASFQVAQIEISDIRQLLATLLVDTKNLLEFEVAVKTGKVLMTVRKTLLALGACGDVPAPATTQVPVVELSPLQMRFIPEAKQGMFIKLLEAFHSAVQDIYLLFNEIVYGVEGPQRVKANDSALVSVVTSIHLMLREHRKLLESSLAKRADMELAKDIEDALLPETQALTALLNVWETQLAEGSCDVSDVCARLLRAKLALESNAQTADEVPQYASGVALNAETAKTSLGVLREKLGAVSELMQSPNATSAVLMDVAHKTRIVKNILEKKR